DSPPEAEPSIDFEVLQWRCAHSNVRTATEVVEARGEFCFVALDVTNWGTDPATLDPSCQFLIDDENARYTPHPEVMALDELAVDGFGRPIGPGEVVQNSALYYDVPKGTSPARLELHETCDGPGRSVPLTPDLEA
ncbi:MAG: DUF4352 domain-containing protein, partial [Actinomycetota bacterium]